MAESSASREQLETFGRVLASALADRGLTSGALLEIPGATTTEGARGVVRKWITGKAEPSRPKVLAIESVLGLAPGTLSRCLGWIPVGANGVPDVETAIMADPDLTAAQRSILLAAVDDFRRR